VTTDSRAARSRVLSASISRRVRKRDLQRRTRFVSVRRPEKAPPTRLDHRTERIWGQSGLHGPADVRAEDSAMALELRLPEPALTEEMLLALSRENPGYCFERSTDGKLVVSAPTGFFSSADEGELFKQVAIWTDSSGLGEAYPATAGMTLPDTSIKSPDATYVTNETLAALTPEDYRPVFIHIVPDVVFELVSPSDDLSDVEKKIDAFIANGVRVGVMLDPNSQTVTIFRPNTERKTYATGLVEIGLEMPGFVLDAAMVFRRSKRRGLQ